MTDINNKVEFNVHKIKNEEPVDSRVLLKGSYWSWGGIRNDFPEQLYKWFEGSSIHGAIIRAKSNYVMGTGLYCESENPELQNFLKQCNRYGDTLQDVLEKAVLDYLIYGSLALNPVWTVGTGKIKELYWLGVDTLRYDKEQTHLIKSPDWSKGLRSSTPYPVFDLEDRKGSQVYYYNGKSRGMYGVPSYIAAQEDIKASVKISRFHANKVGNSLYSDIYVQFPGNPASKEEKELVEKGFNKKFSGESSETSVIFAWDQADGKDTRITSLQQQDPEGKRYVTLRASVRDAIIAAHNLTSPSLIGIPSPGTLSFDSVLADAYQVFINSVIYPLQEEILKPFERLLSINFGEVKLKLKPLPVIQNNFTDEGLIASYMTEEEVREQLMRQGRVKSVSYTGVLNKDKAADVAAGQPVTDSGAVSVVNENLKNLSGRQSQQMLRTIRQFHKGTIDEAAARLLLKNSLGLTDTDCDTLLGLNDNEEI